MQVYSQIYNESYAFWGGNTTLNYISPVSPLSSAYRQRYPHDSTPASHDDSFADCLQATSDIALHCCGTALQVLHTVVLQQLSPETRSGSLFPCPSDFATCFCILLPSQSATHLCSNTSEIISSYPCPLSSAATGKMAS